MQTPIGVSNRHIHLSQKDADALFGKNYTFKKLKELSQPGQYAYKEIVTAKGPKGNIKNIRILGPVRTATQVEILASDNFILGINAPIRISGDLANSGGGIKLIGPKGEVQLDNGIIIAQRHLHISIEKANEWNLKNGDIIKIQTTGIRSVIFDNVIVRANERFRLDCHIDREEGNAAGLEGKNFGTIIK